MFDWATQPFYTLVLTFLFAPYFANVVIGDPVRGQALWGYAIGAAGLVVALVSPVLGAVADASGRRKPWIAVFSVGLVLGLLGLWFAEPGGGASLVAVIAAVVLATVSVEFATVFYNAVMPGLVSRDRLGRLSGIGWAIGYVGGLASLVILAGLLIPDSTSGRTLLGLAPLLPVETATHEGDRLVGPFCALWYVLFVIPFFWFTPDATASTGPVRASVVREGLRRLVETAKNARAYAGVLRFLVARMLYVDGLGAIFAFGGVYAASLFDWRAVELGMFGIILTIAGTIGALIGGVLDDRRGAKSVILLALTVLIFATVGVVSIDRERVLFVFEVAPAVPDRPFGSVGEQVYLFFAVLIGLAAGPLQAASRSLFARLAPPDMMTKFFGLFAFSGKITSFAAPLLIGAVTTLSGSQRLGVAVVLAFLLAGFAIMRTVQAPK